jgi:hypothetical protein
MLVHARDQSPEKPCAETPLARALRLKKAALETKPSPPGRGKFAPRQAARMASGASKPAMKK